jgi:hypothetical protein
MSSVQALRDRLISDFAHGIEEHRYTSVVAFTKRYVLFRIHGHSAWSSVSTPREYVPVQFVLIRKGQWWMGRDTQKQVWYGRTAHSVLVKALEQAERTGQLEG